MVSPAHEILPIIRGGREQAFRASKIYRMAAVGVMGLVIIDDVVIVPYEVIN